jgi:hypothetical protein
MVITPLSRAAADQERSRAGRATDSEWQRARLWMLVGIAPRIHAETRLSSNCLFPCNRVDF